MGLLAALLLLLSCALPGVAFRLHGQHEAELTNRVQANTSDSRQLDGLVHLCALRQEAGEAEQLSRMQANTMTSDS